METKLTIPVEFKTKWELLCYATPEGSSRELREWREFAQWMKMIIEIQIKTIDNLKP